MFSFLTNAHLTTSVNNLLIFLSLFKTLKKYVYKYVSNIFKNQLVLLLTCGMCWMIDWVHC